MGKSIDEQIQEADRALVAAVTEYGPDHEIVAEKLVLYAAVLRRSKTRLLDAVNMEARANVIMGAAPSNTSPSSARTHQSQPTSGSRLWNSVEKVFSGLSSKSGLLEVWSETCSKTDKESKHKRQFCSKRAIAVSVLVLLLVAIGTTISVLRPNLSTEKATPEFNVTGAVWVTKGSGESDIQRGMKVILCKPGATEGYQKWRMGVSPVMPQLVDPYNFVSLHQLSSTTSDVDGKFSFSHVPPGTFYVFAKYESAFSYAVWFVPITVSDCDIKVDLCNNNFDYTTNKSF